MLSALLETIGALSLFVSVAAQIALLREDSADDAPKPSTVRQSRAACCRRKPNDRPHDPAHMHGAHREQRMRLDFSARHVRAGAGRTAFSRTRKPG